MDFTDSFSSVGAIRVAGTEEGDFCSQRSGKGWQGFGEGRISMRKLLTDSANRNNKKIWNILFDAVKKQYEQGNEKLYLKQAYDTAQLFNATRQLFVIAQGLDSVEMIPNKKENVSLISASLILNI